LSRTEAARALGVDKATIRRLEKRGILSSTGQGREQRRIDPRGLRAALVATRRRRPTEGRAPGEVAALAFTLFERKLSFHDVVVLLRITPIEVRELHRAWQEGFEAPQVEHGAGAHGKAPRGAFPAGTARPAQTVADWQGALGRALNGDLPDIL
jgi:hypothetical protein